MPANGVPSFYIKKHVQIWVQFRACRTPTSSLRMRNRIPSADAPALTTQIGSLGATHSQTWAPFGMVSANMWKQNRAMLSPVLQRIVGESNVLAVELLPKEHRSFFAKHAPPNIGGPWFFLKHVWATWHWLPAKLVRTVARRLKIKPQDPSARLQVCRLYR